MAEMRMTREGFRNHMCDKCEQWGAKQTFIGEDFAVFEFEYAYRCKEAIDNLTHYSEYYGYRVERNDKHLVVINKCHKEE